MHNENMGGFRTTHLHFQQDGTMHLCPPLQQAISAMRERGFDRAEMLLPLQYDAEGRMHILTDDAIHVWWEGSNDGRHIG